MTRDAGLERRVFTVGHSRHTWEQFLALLVQHGIQAIADVRSVPWSRFAPWSRRATLASHLEASDLHYVFLGNVLGGRPAGAALVDAASRAALYESIAASPAFHAGIDRLEAGAARYRIAVMCSEENPAYCHRTRLIAPALLARGVTVTHIRGDGTLEEMTGSTRQTVLALADDTAR